MTAILEPRTASLLKTVQRTLFSTSDSVCLERARLMTDADRLYRDQPAPLRRAMSLRHLLEHMTLDVASNPLLAGNTSTSPRAWMLLPEFGFVVDAQAQIEHEEFKGFLDGQIPPTLREYWAGRAVGGSAAPGHLAVDLDRVVNEGLASIASKVRSSTAGDATYREAMVIALDAVVAWADRYADAALLAAQDADDPVLEAAHHRVAAACRHVPQHPARNLFEGLQSIVLVHLAMAIEGQGLSVSIGLADRALARFSDEVEADPDQAVADLSAFLLKIAAQSFHGRVSKTQAMTIGGRDANGDDVCNAVTLAILEAFDQTPVNDPHLFLRWHDQADARVLQKASQMLARGRSMPLLVGDDPTIAGFVRVGIKPQDAADYCIIGCNELGIPGRAWETGCSLGGGLNYLRLLEQTLLTHAPDVHSMDDLWQRLRVALTNQLDPVVQSRDRIQRRYADKVPAPLTTALMTASEARCVDLMCDMPYRQRGFFERGLSDAANALMSIEQHVFIDQSISLPDLLQAMRDNWAGEAATVRDTMTCAPRWGNDVPAVDAFALRLIALRQEVLEQIEARDAVRFTPCHVVRSLHHLDGRSIGATPDGRFAGQMVGDSVGGICGTMNEGPTAMLNSVLKIDAARYYAGGYNLNLTLPGGLCDERIIAALISGFFQARGQELQVNVLDTAKLRAARANPDAYRDLVVRMAGLSARFIELSTLEQDELIARAEAAVR